MTAAAVTDAPDTVLVVDFGAQYAQLIARRVREARVYSEIVRHDTPAAELLARRPKGIILSGGPESVYAEWAPAVDPALYDAGRAHPGHLLRRPAPHPAARRRRWRAPAAASTGARRSTRSATSPLFADWPPRAPPTCG